MKAINCSLLLVLALNIPTAANAAGSAALRIVCDGDAEGAEVYINGKSKGECPLDLKVPEGKLKLRVQKAVDADHERLFEQEIRLGDGVMKKVEVQLGEAELNAARKEQQQKRWAPIRAALKAQGINLSSDNTFRDCPECPEMVGIPAGRFQMGSPGSEAGRGDDEGPMHEVKIGQFTMGKYEVTVGEFRRFAVATGYRTDAEKDTGNKQGCFSWDRSDGKFAWRTGRYWDNPGFPQNDRQPAVCISWNDAGAYAEWLSSKTGKQYRLPTEAEWEYAARAGATTARYWGDDPDQVCKYANVADQTEHEGQRMANRHECNDGNWFTAPVGSYQPNAFGLYDMLGNALEWVADTWHGSYGGAPVDGSVWQDGAGRVLRGGSWISAPQEARAALRLRYLMANRYFNSGFRLARTLP